LDKNKQDQHVIGNFDDYSIPIYPTGPPTAELSRPWQRDGKKGGEEGRKRLKDVGTLYHIMDSQKQEDLFWFSFSTFERLGFVRELSSRKSATLFVSGV
jgi:hypothetical protein